MNTMKLSQHWNIIQRSLFKFLDKEIGGLSENDFICAAKIDELRPEAI